MKKEEFFYDSRDGISKLHAVRYTPDNQECICGVVQVVHGMSEYIERYEELAEYLTGHGYVVTGEDHMGHGKSVGPKNIYGYFCEKDPVTTLVRDVHRLKKRTQELYPEVPYVMLGHSMGSFIVRIYMCRYGTGINGAIILGTGMQTMSLLRASKVTAAVQKFVMGSDHVSNFIDKAGFGGYNQEIENPRTKYDWLTRDEAKVNEYIADPLCGFVFTVNGFETLFELISRQYRVEDLKRIPKKLPVLILSGSDDPVGEYGKGVQRTYESLRNAGLENVGMKLYQGARHELLNETNRAEVMSDINRWLNVNVIKEQEEQNKQSKLAR